MNGTIPTYGTRAESYVPPEVKLALDPTHEERQVMREKADIYALGLTAYEVVADIFS